MASAAISLTAALITNAVPAKAALMLTAAGTADGFVLTEFAALNPANGGFGPFGVANNGKVIVSNFPNNTIYTFNDVDGQTPATALTTLAGKGTGTAGMASAGGNAYGENPANGRFAQYNQDGTINHDLTGVAATVNLGMAGVLAGPEAGHIIATSSIGIIDIDPAANGGTGAIVHNYGGGADGISTSPDGTEFCAEQGSINCYKISDGSLVSSTGGFPSPDGTAEITGGLLNGDLIVNNNNGDVDLFDFATNQITIIATGVGERGDYAMTDPATGTLLLDESSGVWRLALAGGCIGVACNGGGGSVPEPMSLALLASGLFGLGIIRRKLAS